MIVNKKGNLSELNQRKEKTTNKCLINQQLQQQQHWNHYNKNKMDKNIIKLLSCYHQMKTDESPVLHCNRERENSQEAECQFIHTTTFYSVIF